MIIHEALRALLVLAIVIVVGPALAFRIRLPAAVVLIVMGIAVGPAGVGWVDPDQHAVALLSELGFLVLMFIAGMEIDFPVLRVAGARALAAPSLTVLGFAALAIACGRLLGRPIIDVLMLTATSVGMPIAVLQESGTLGTPLGRHVLLTASLGEFASIVAITFFEVFTRDASALERALRIGKVALLFVVGALLIRWARALVWWHPEPFRRLVRRRDVAELGVRTGMLLMFGFVVLSALLGVEAILGAFLGGALVSFVLHEKAVLEAKIAALGQGLFVPIFFVVVGVRFDPTLLDATALRTAGVLVVATGVVKVASAMVFAPRELGARERLASGSLLAAPLTLVVALAAIGRRLGALDERGEASYVLVALALSVLFPIGFRWLSSVRATGRTPTTS